MDRPHAGAFEEPTLHQVRSRASPLETRSSLDVRMGRDAEYDGKRREKVRCGLEFRGLLDSLFAPTRFGIPGPRDACAVLMGLWERILPKARDVFTGAYSAPRLFAHSEYTMEGAFLYGVIVLSKLLGHEKWPVGLYSPWPPPLPEELQPEVPSSLVDA